MLIFKLDSVVKYDRHKCFVVEISRDGVRLQSVTKKRVYKYLLSLREAENLEVLEV